MPRGTDNIHPDCKTHRENPVASREEGNIFFTCIPAEDSEDIWGYICAFLEKALHLQMIIHSHKDRVTRCL